LAVVIAGLGVIVGITRFRGGFHPVHSDPSAVPPVPTAGGPGVGSGPTTLASPVTPQRLSTEAGTQRPAAAGANEAATEPGAYALPSAWCTGPMPLQASAIDDDARRLVPLPVDPVRCVVHVGADAGAGAPVEAVSLYRPGFRPVGVYLADVGADGQGWPMPTPLSGPLIGCPGEPGVVVAQVETAAAIEPLERLCLGLCVPVAPLVADPKGCLAMSYAVWKLSELPLLWEVVSLRGRAGAGGAW
jgi:hypothetical protein